MQNALIFHVKWKFAEKFHAAQRRAVPIIEHPFHVSPSRRGARRPKAIPFRDKCGGIARSESLNYANRQR